MLHFEWQSAVMARAARASAMPLWPSALHVKWHVLQLAKASERRLMGGILEERDQRGAPARGERNAVGGSLELEVAARGQGFGGVAGPCGRCRRIDRPRLQERRAVA